jgi:hypothetical protein
LRNINHPQKVAIEAHILGSEVFVSLGCLQLNLSGLRNI